MLTREHADAIKHLILAGHKCSNVLFNIRSMGAVDKEYYNLCTQTRLEWDSARKDASDAMRELYCLQPAFDPIELGC